MRRGVLFLLAIVVVGGAVVWWIASGPLTRSDGASGGPTRSSASDAAATANAATTAATRTNAERSSDARPAEAPPPLAAGVVVEPPPEHGIPLLVVEKESGKPQPFALVTWFDGEFPNDTFVNDLTPDERDLDWLLDHVGRRFRADENGLLRVAPAPGSLELFARAGAKLGATSLSLLDQTVDEKSPPRKLEVEPRRSLRVQVADAGGRPVDGVELKLLEGVDSPIVRVVASITTRGQEGVAEFRGAQLLFDGEASSEPAFGFEFAQRHPAKLRVKRSDLDGPPLRLTLPAVGSVELVLVDCHGAAVPAEGSADVVVYGSPRPKSNLFGGDEEETDQLGTQSARFVRGHATMRFVAVGSWIQANADFDEWGAAAVYSAGPKVAGDHVRIEMALDHDAKLLRGRVVDEHGAPIGPTPLHVRFDLRFKNHADPIANEALTRSAADGSFQLALPNIEEYSEVCAGRFEVVHFGLPRGVDLVGRIELSEAIAHGGGDVGAITLRPPPLVASGVVVDDRGEPVDGVWLSLGVRSSQTRQQASLGLETVTRRDGTFELRGDPGPELYQLSARRGRYGTVDPTPIELGATDVRIVLPRAAGIAVHLLLDHDMPLDAAVVCVEQHGRDDGGDRVEDQGPDARGDVCFGDFEPGKVKVSVLLNGFGEQSREVLAIDGIELAAGTITHDPRLDAVDLRGQSRHVHLVVVDEEGQPVENGSVVAAHGAPTPIETTDGETLYSSTTDDVDERAFVDGHLELVTLGGHGDVDVTSPGFRRQRVTLVAPTTKVVLRRSLDVTVEVDPPPANLPDTAELYFDVDEQTDENGQHEHLVSDATGHLRVDGPGQYHLHLRVALEDAQHEYDVEELEKSATTFTVAAAPQHQTVRVHLVQDELTALLAKAKSSE